MRRQLYSPRRGQSAGLLRIVSTSLAVTVLLLTVAAADGRDTLEGSFITPPDCARPWVYWFWMNGNITKEGITADLEAMHQAGIGGALIMHVGAGIPPGPVKFFSDEWRALFQYAVSEAHRLGLEVTMNACDGWTGTGGPWIQPEEGMMKLVWTETRLRGPSEASVTLPQAPANLDVYHDVAVLAFPTPPASAAAVAAPKPTVTSSDPNCDGRKLTDGNPRTVTAIQATQGFPWIQFEFAEPCTARGVSFSAAAANTLPASAKVQVSDDGRAFRTISDATFGWKANIPSMTISFDDTTSRFFRIVLPPSRTVFSELDLLGEGRVNYWEVKAGFARRWGHGADAECFAWRQAGGDVEANGLEPSWANQPIRFAVDQASVCDVSSHMGASGRLDWEIPEGQWTVLRIGYTPTGEKNGPASEEGTGLEPDALDPQGIGAAFSRFIAKLLSDVGPRAGDTLRYCHIDSWETGEQNWTAAFREEFRKRRGYDMTPFLPVMAGGRVVGSLDISERFLWDVRRTIADMLAEYYYGRMREVCRESGIRFGSEAAGAQQFLFDPITYQRQADLPMGEFWVTEGRVRPDCKAAASVAHIFEKQFVGAEAFTSGWTKARWTQHPFSLKSLGDEAFCMGVNRFIFHRYAMQPWLDVRPGMTMGPWGIHFERTNTWWEPGSAWMRYLARCQSLLQQGRFVGEVLYFTGEGAPNYLGYRHELIPPLPPGYDFDACNAEVLLNLVSVRDGRLVLDNGMEYRLLLLPNQRTMTPQLLQKIQSLVQEGAVVVGPKPKQAPGLSDYPHCDQQVREAADALWGPAAAPEEVDRDVGQGRVFSGRSFEEIFARLGLVPDFSYRCPDGEPLRYIHRHDDTADWYFVASPALTPRETTCTFRISGRRPELWDPETGQITRPAVYREAEGRTTVPIRFEPSGSVFIVFRKQNDGDSIHTVQRNGQRVLSTAPAPSPTDEDAPLRTLYSPNTASQTLYPEVSGSFAIAFWVKPAAPIKLPPRSDAGVTGGSGQRFVLFPEQGEIAYGAGHASAGISVGTNGICVFEHSARYFPARLVHELDIKDWMHVALVYEQNHPLLYLNGVEAISAPQSSHIVHPCRKQGHGGAYTGAVRGLRILHRELSPEQIAAMADRSQLRVAGDLPSIEITKDDRGKLSALVWTPGTYSLVSGDADTKRIQIDELAGPFPLQGPWQVRFPPGGGAPESVVFDELISWIRDQRPGVKYFSGTAEYVKTVDVPPSLFTRDCRLYLDLGEVQVLAEVQVNGKNLGVLWKPPFRADATEFLQPGENKIEIRVTNLWPNRLIGDEQFPPDGTYGPAGQGGRIVAWPEWFRDGKRRPEPRRLTFASWKHYGKDSPLLPSGLLGPVVIRTVAMREIPAVPNAEE